MRIRLRGINTVVLNQLPQVITMKPNPPQHSQCGRVQTLMRLSLAAFVLLAGSVSVAAQANATTAEWVMLSPEGEEFSISMPRESNERRRRADIPQMVLKTRLYLAAQKSPDRCWQLHHSVGSNPNPALYTEFQRMNSYVDAFKIGFRKK